MRTVVVTDGGERSALAVVRALGAAGYRCVVVAREPRSLAGASRYAARSYAAPSPLHAPAEFVQTLQQIVRDEGAALLIPISEPSLLAVLPHRDAFPGCAIPFADDATFRAISDKQGVLAEAHALGIAIPSQVVVHDPEAARALNANDVRYPVVVKPARSVGESSGAREKLGVQHASGTAQLRDVLAALSPAAFPVLLQQRVAGAGTGVFLLVWDGEVRASFAHRRLTEKPPSGGVSVDRESVALDPHLLELSRALLARFNWTGVAMIEYKVDHATGIPYLMEINGRFWGSLQLAIDSGVNFPVMLAALALGETVPASAAYDIGVRSRWFWGQIDHLVSRLPRGGRPRALPPGTISVPRAVMDVVFAPFRRTTREEIFRWNDVRPFLYESGRWLRGK